MGKVKSSLILNRMLGKKVSFQGKFPWGELDRLKAMAEAQQAIVVEALDASVGYLVLADLAGGKTVQKKALTLNAKGANVQVVDGDGFKKLVEPTAQEILALIRGVPGTAGILKKVLAAMPYRSNLQQQASFVIAGENFDGADLSELDLTEIDFDRCSFVGAKCHGTDFAAAGGCDFSRADAKGAQFHSAEQARFVGAGLGAAVFEASVAGSDFTSAALEQASFGERWRNARSRLPSGASAIFSKANLRSASFGYLDLNSARFDGADLTAASIAGPARGADFRGAVLEKATLAGADLTGADLSNANLRGASLMDADLTDAVVRGADLDKCNLRGAKLNGLDLGTAKNYQEPQSGAVGPSLTELDNVSAKARRIKIAFRVRQEQDHEGEEVGFDTAYLQYGWGLKVPSSMGIQSIQASRKTRTFSDAMLELARLLGDWQVRYETLDVSSTKSPTGGKELRDLVMKAIAEAFAQPIPDEEKLAEATKAHREAVREQSAADRERREKARAAAEKEKETEKKQIAKKIAKTVGKVTDIATFLKALELRIEKPKIDKATKMLKAERFKLFNDIGEEAVSGVVKSQTDPDLVYACRIEQDGHYACCTQNLNICGGLRGSVCKHLLVLIIGLVKAGELDPTTIDGWIAKSHDKKAELDKEAMGAIFIKYKGAEAGEVDWRPTETLPEDYYSL